MDQTDSKMRPLKDKVTIITGAGSGIGAGIARYFASCGAKLVLADKRAEELQQVISECEKLVLNKDNIHQITCDLSVDDNMQKLIDETILHFGHLDVLINNAGIMYMAEVENSSMEKFDDVMNINLRTPYNMIRLAIPELKKSKGTIVNISSTCSVTVEDGMAAYHASKAGLDHLTRCAASELGPFGIRVNAVNPGAVKTSLLTHAGLSEEEIVDHRRGYVEKYALGRFGTVDEIAKVVAFIASDDASFMTGASVLVDGGYSVMGKK